MNEEAMRRFFAARQLGRREALRAGGAAAGGLALLAVGGRSNSAGAATMLTVEMAEDIRTFRLNPGDPAKSNGVPVVGDTFIEFGSLYPAGTIQKGLKGPDQAGTIGRWICRGTFVNDAASGVAPQVITTVLMVFGAGLSATQGRPEQAADALLTEGFEGIEQPIRRIVVGGYGRYAGASGEMLQTLREENDTALNVAGMKVPGGNYTFAFTFSHP